MAVDLDTLRATVVADLPWHPEAKLRGTLLIEGDALVLERRDREPRRVEIPLSTIDRSTVEMAFGLMPALHVWHTVQGREYRSRFEFSPEEDGDEPAEEGRGMADRIGPGVAREAAQKIEGGFRVLSGGLNLGKRAARQAVEGLAHQEEYRVWPAAISQAQAGAKRRGADAGAHAPNRTAPAPAAIVPPEAQVPRGDATALFTWFREQILGWLAGCAERARQLGVRGIPVIQPLYPLDADTCRIVVIGEFSRGKSTAINALFGIHGEIALPAGMTPTTPIVCAIRVPRIGETDGATIGYRSKRHELTLSLDEFRRAVRVADEGADGADGTPGSDLHLDEAARVEVRVTGAYLPSGVEIEDTPGLNEQAGRSRGAMAALGRADLILFVLAADQLLGDLERRLIDRTLIEGFHRNVLFLVNFWDTIEDEGQRQVLRRRADATLKDFPSPFRGTSGSETADAGGSLADVFYVSALQAARAQRQHKAAPEESGIPGLRSRLRQLLGPEWHALLLRSRAGRALRYEQILRQAVSKTGASLGVEAAGGQSRPAAAARTRDGAVAAALRVCDGLPGAMEGATARLQASLERGDADAVRQLENALDRAGAKHDGTVGSELRRSIAATLRTIAADYGRAAQDAVDLIAAQARAAFLTHGLTPPLLDARFEPYSFTVPDEPDVEHFRALLRAAPELLRRDLADKGQQIGAVLATSIREPARDDARRAQGAAEQAGEPAANARERLAGLRLLEDDLLRIDGLLRRVLDR